MSQDANAELARLNAEAQAEREAQPEAEAVPDFGERVLQHVIEKARGRALPMVGPFEKEKVIE